MQLKIKVLSGFNLSKKSGFYYGQGVDIEGRFMTIRTVLQHLDKLVVGSYLLLQNYDIVTSSDVPMVKIHGSTKVRNSIKSNF